MRVRTAAVMAALTGGTVTAGGGPASDVGELLNRYTDALFNDLGVHPLGTSSPVSCLNGHRSVRRPPGLALRTCVMDQQGQSVVIGVELAGGGGAYVLSDGPGAPVPKTERDRVLAGFRKEIRYFEAVRTLQQPHPQDCFLFFESQLPLQRCSVEFRQGRTLLTVQTTTGLRFFFDGFTVHDFKSQQLPTLHSLTCTFYEEGYSTCSP
ncbi:hypothetical protein [Deinococcus sonorensis]|uniref:Uncharacterized protein n=2 Tax=Deinococcus sonorensis TaxID=309891 RepID=A0AAU7UBU0_9DEIO